MKRENYYTTKTLITRWFDKWGPMHQIKKKMKKTNKKVNTLKQKLQLVYNIQLSNVTRRRYISLFMCFVSQRARK